MPYREKRNTKTVTNQRPEKRVAIRKCNCSPIVSSFQPMLRKKRDELVQETRDDIKPGVDHRNLPGYP